MLSIGGWTGGSEKYSQMAMDPSRRSIFVNSVLQLLLKYGFDGVDFDWEYPGNREGANATVDRDDFSLLAEELKNALRPYDLLLSGAFGCGRNC